MVPIKIFVSTILTKLQRLERRANVYYAAGPGWRIGGKADSGQFDLVKVKFNVHSEYDVSFDHTGFQSPVRTGDFRICDIAFTLYTFALLSKRCSFVKMIATKIFVRTIFVENFMKNIFDNLTFFSKLHISRGNQGKMI